MENSAVKRPAEWDLPVMIAVGSQQGIASASLARACDTAVMGVSFHALAYALIGLFAIAIGVVVSLLVRRVSPGRSNCFPRTVLDAAAAALAAVSIVGLVLANPGPGVAFALCAACSVGIAWFDLRWGENLSKLPTEDLLRAVIVRIVIGSAWLIAACAIPPSWKTCMVCVTSIVAGFLLLRFVDPISWGERELYYPKEALPGFGGIAVGVLAVGLLFGLREYFDYADDSVVGVLSNAIVIVIGLTAYGWVFKARKTIDFDLLFRASLVVFAVGVFLAPFGSAWVSSIAECLMSLVVLLITNVVALLCAYVARHSSLHPFLIFGAFHALYGVPRLLVAAIEASGISEGYLGAEQGGFYHALMFLVIVAAVAFSFIRTSPDIPPVFGDLFSPRIGAPDGQVDTKDNFERVFASMEEKYQLTKREGEVMRLICHGRSKAFIAETLYLSENTVRMYSKSLYSKLGVHSKQELIDVAEGHARSMA